MSQDPFVLAYDAIDQEHQNESAHTRRTLVKGAAAAFGSMGLLGLTQAQLAEAGTRNDIPTLLNVAATAEVLATIVNTVGGERVTLDPTTRRNVRAAAREELIHYQVLTSDAIGAKPLTKRIWIPDAVFANRTNFLTTLVGGDQLFINAYLIATTVFGNRGEGRLARIAAEFMGVEGVHRALALQSLGKLGNDRVFMKYSQPEDNEADPFFGQPGFRLITSVTKYLDQAGIGLGEEGGKPGRFYDFDDVARRTPPVTDDLNTLEPR